MAIRTLTSLEPSAQLEVDDTSAASEARRLVRGMVEQLNFDETTAGEAAIVATELAGNIAKHARSGRIYFRATEGELEILAIDRGPGIRDVSRSLTDGYSTAGSPGTGLGAAKRLARTFDIHSVPGRGTVVLARLAPRGAPSPNLSIQVGGITVPIHGETLCGDAWAVTTFDDRIEAVMADGLGHGPDAAKAARASVQAFQRGGEAMEQKTASIHAALRATRGAALALALIPLSPGQVRFVGVGNIAASIRTTEGTKNLVSANGIVGHQMPGYREYTYDWPPGAMMIMHSDGLKSQWALDEPGLMQRHASIIAAVLIRDFSRERDDAAVLVVRQRLA